MSAPALNDTLRPHRAPALHPRGGQCTFDVLDMNALQDPCSGAIVHLYALVLRCHACETIFKATEGAGFASMSGARLLRCPTGCGQQVVKAPALRGWRAPATEIVAPDATMTASAA